MRPIVKQLYCNRFVCLAWLLLSAAGIAAICPQGDVSGDCRVDLDDVAVLAEQWLTEGTAANLNDDSIVNWGDFGAVSSNWGVKVSRVIISELMADNTKTIRDDENQFSDWIELYNVSPTAVSLAGWYLTDNPNNLCKWALPDVEIAAGGFLIVWASGQDRREPSGPLHTNFSLKKEGEYLALVEPDGVTIASEYKPKFPAQFPDISYGVSMTVCQERLIGSQTACRYSVPQNSSQIGQDWAATDFDDSTWSSGVLGLGYDAGTVGTVWENVARGKPATQSSNYSASYPASNAVDGIYNNFSHTASNDTNSTWQVNLGGDYYISKIILYNRTGCCWPRLRDITVTVRDAQNTQDLFVSDLLNPENILLGPMTLEVDVESLTGSVIPGGIVKVHRTPDPDNSAIGIGTDTGTTGQNSLTLAEVEVWGSSNPVNLYGPLIQTNIRDEMQHRSSSVFVRIPFEVADKTRYDYMELRVRYDDGFVVYLNGAPAASRNAPTASAWNSAATAEHPKLEAIAYESVNLTSLIPLLRNGTNVLAVQGFNLAAEDDDFLFDAELVAGRVSAGAAGFLTQPTAGGMNGAETFGAVADTKFSVNRGYYEEPFEVAITTSTAGATIYYTTDGSTPSAGSGSVYTEPIPITKTTCLRAVAVKPGCLSTNVDTQTYIFLDDIIHQSASPPGYPTTWTTYTGAAYPADYEMDPDIINPILSTDPNLIKDALRSLPVMSLVTDKANLFDPAIGIYANSGEFAVDLPDGSKKWEVPVSMEYFDPVSGRQTQEDCGLRIQGAYFRKPGSTPKHSFRLLFKRMYGRSKLYFNLFDYDDEAADSFDTLVLRAQGNDGYSWASMGGKSQYIRDEFSRRVYAAMGQAASHGTFVHLYINGLYWGLYNPVERPDSSFCASYYGGKKEDWDVFKHPWLDLNEGTREAMTAMQTLFQYDIPLGSAVISDSDYWKLQGCNPDGTRNPDFPVLLDVDNFIDYMLVNFWTGNQDWCWNDNNYWLGRLRVGQSTGFKFFCWDTEDNLDSPRSPVTLDMIAKVYQYDVYNTQKPTIARLQNRLMTNAQYRLRFADHAHKYLFNGGLMTAQPARALYSDLANQVELAIIAESARWGDQHAATPWTQTHWINERNYILNTYFPQRVDNVIAQLKAKGLYPAVDAPVFKIDGLWQHGGQVSSAAVFSMEAAGPVWFTTDLTDPRLPAGGISPSAIEYTQPFFLNQSQCIKARTLSGGVWSALNEATYSVGPIAAALRITEIMYHPAADPNAEFIELQNIGSAAVNLNLVRFTKGIDYTFGPTVLEPLEYVVLVRDAAAFRAAYPDFSGTIGGVYGGSLSNAGETIRLADACGGIIHEFTYKDDWYENTDGQGFSLSIRDAAGDLMLWNQKAGWRSSTVWGGTPGY
ncbi:MAG TPA: lamin tail domain-containing protein [Anaerohalosphaeraceae bacterium]|nr:lamin tail domain-containing protein [Anaerohalosphaeraceae bacterium]HRV18949.1 lamin tail domain-containing protein [Anaerohalosphaeraceae bacterium]